MKPSRTKINLRNISPALIAGAMLAGCSLENDFFNEEPSKEICKLFSEPGEYKVKSCDLFLGPFGVHFRIDQLDEFSQIRGSYVDNEGITLLTDHAFGNGWNIAHYGLNLYSEKKGIMTLTDDPKDLYDRCVRLINSPEADSVNHCSVVSPTEALGGEVLFKSGRGYFGKTNEPAYPQLAECFANDVEYIVIHTSKLLDLPPLHHGISYMSIFKNKQPLETGVTIFSVSAWFYQKDDLDNINYLLTKCNQKLDSGNFSKGNHELTHAFTKGFNMPFTFSEGFANYVPRVLNYVKPDGWDTAGEQWNTTESVCKEKGFQKGYGVYPYIKYHDDPKTYDSYLSGECFWQKLVHDYGIDVIPMVMGVFKKNVGKDKTFEENLLESGIDTNKYLSWGLGER